MVQFPVFVVLVVRELVQVVEASTRLVVVVELQRRSVEDLDVPQNQSDPMVLHELLRPLPFPPHLLELGLLQ